MAILPRNVKKLKVFLAPILDDIHEMQIKRNMMYDAYTEEEIDVTPIPVSYIGDIRGNPYVTGQNQPPAINGTCITCDVSGLTLVAGSTVYFGAVTMLPEHHRLRNRFRRTFAHVPKIQRLYNKKVKYRTNTEVMALGLSAELNLIKAQDGGFHFRHILTTALSGIQPLSSLVYRY